MIPPLSQAGDTHAAFIPRVVPALRERDQYLARLGNALRFRAPQRVISTRFHSSEIFDAAP